MKKLLIASGNSHKVGEIRAILKDVALEVFSLKDLASIPEDPEENGGSFVSNARIKALAYGENFEGWVLADDSGLVVPKLDGEPGIYSARYAGSESNDTNNRNKLKEKIKKYGAPLPAYFVCSLCLKKEKSTEVICFEAHWHGSVIDSDRGEGGFGYDPIFIPTNSNLSAAEMSSSEKNKISHRAKALQQFKTFLEVQ